MVRESIDWLGGEYDLEWRESIFSCTAAAGNTSTPQASTNVVLCCYGVVFIA